MASGGLPHQPLSATFPAQFAKESLGPSNAGLLDNRGSAPASALPSSDAHPRHIVHDERDAFILWLRGEFAAANAIIDAMCNHLHVIGEPSEYDYLLACIQRRRFNWNVVLNMQQYFPVEEVNNALQQAALRKQQVRNQNNQPSMPHHNVEELKDPRTINLFRGSNGDAQNVIPQAEVSVSDMSVIMNRDLPLSNLSLPQELYNGKVIQNPASRMSKFDASQTRSKTVIDSMEQTTSQTSPNLTLAKSPVGQEIILGPENNTSTVLMKHPGTFGGKLFNADFTTLSREDQDARLPMIKVSKHFQCWEQAEGNLVNVAEGLELYENVLSSYEASQIAGLITELLSAGRQGQLGGNSFVVEKRITGGSSSVKEVIQFSTNENKSSGDSMDPMPLVFNSLIDRLILWHILPANKRPNYCCIEVLEENEESLPFLSYQHVDQYFCCLFLVAESRVIFGRKLTLDGGDYNSGFKLLLPLGSALVIQGNSAEVANRLVLPSPLKRIMITFARLLHNKGTNVLHSGGKFTHVQPGPLNSILMSTPPVPSWPMVGLPGAPPPGVHGFMPAMMKHINMANASGVLPVSPLRPFSHIPHPIPQHLAPAAGNVQAIVPGPPQPFPSLVLNPSGWQPVPSRVPPRPPNTGTGVFFPSSGSGSAGNSGKPQMQSGLVMVTPVLQKSEPLVALSQAPLSENQQNKLQKPATSSTEQVDHAAETADAFSSWHSSSGASNEPLDQRKSTRKDGPKAGPNGNGIIKEDQQQRSFQRSNKGGGNKS